MKRREFIVGFGCTTAVGSFVARAQQLAIPVIGFLHGQSSDGFGYRLAYLHRGLNELGFVEGRNVAVEYRWANNQLEQLQTLAVDLVRRRVAVIVAPDGTASPIAAKAVTSTIPIVFVMGADPVKLGLVASLNQPGTNLTGVNTILWELAGKRLELLCELAPRATTIGYLIDPRSPVTAEVQSVRTAAQALGRQIMVVEARSDNEFEPAFAGLVQRGAAALLINSGVMFTGNRHKLVTLAARYRIPTIYPFRIFAVDGGLMSYGGVDMDAHRLAGVYVGQILKGARAADLPVQQPSKFELVINLKTARALDLAVPPLLRALANEVIE
jgi:putative tryptophan/tyrosine transport system substrate-binding protein